MPARLNPQHDARTRDKIRTTQLVNRLQDYALGKKGVSMSRGQITAAAVLLKKTLPDLVAVEGHQAAPVGFLIMGQPEAASAEAWQRQHGPVEDDFRS